MKRRRSITSFNSVDSGSGYAIRFEQAKSGYWSAVTVDAMPVMIVLGIGRTLGACRKSIRDGIRYGLDGLENPLLPSHKPSNP